MSSIHWTPVQVALRAVELLAPESGSSVLDVGAGCGKLCCIGALTTDSTWYGIECDAERVSTALKTARALDVDRQVRFRCGDMTSVDWSDYGSIYLFNPFEASLLPYQPFDPQTGFEQYTESVRETEDRLADLPTGTRVVTYHGFGGQVPDCYELTAREPMDSDELVLYVKRARTASPRTRESRA